MTWLSVFRELVRTCRLPTVGWVLACALWSGRAAAEAPPIDLEWQAPAECPDRAAVLTRAIALLGDRATKASRVRASGSVERRDDGFELTLLIDDGAGGQRKVWARQCEELGGAAALTLVLLLTTDMSAAPDDGWSSEGPRSSDAAPQPPKPPPAESKPSQPEPSREKPSPSHRNGRLHALVIAPSVALSIGPLPKPEVGAGLGLGLEGGGWSVRLRGHWFWPRAVDGPVAPYGSDVQRAVLALTGCRDLWGSTWWSLAACLEGYAVRLRASGYGPFIRPDSQTNLGFGTGVGALARVYVTDHISLAISGGLRFELTRPRLEIGNIGTVRQLAPLSGVVQLAPEWIF